MNRPTVYIEHAEDLTDLQWMELVLDARVSSNGKEISIPFPIREKMRYNGRSIGKRIPPTNKRVH